MIDFIYDTVQYSLSPSLEHFERSKSRGSPPETGNCLEDKDCPRPVSRCEANDRNPLCHLYHVKT